TQFFERYIGRSLHAWERRVIAPPASKKPSVNSKKSISSKSRGAKSPKCAANPKQPGEPNPFEAF
ncbi:hypothetical protein, partial [Bacteroides caecimuris]|uniref:hypothetical protein n=1 Tax=Bacteroides caecimuris TaxID=1796613 RepID=UPI00266FB491